MSWAAFAVVRGALEELTIWDVEETRMQYLYYFVEWSRPGRLIKVSDMRFERGNGVSAMGSRLSM